MPAHRVRHHAVIDGVTIEEKRNIELDRAQLFVVFVAFVSGSPSGLPPERSDLSHIAANPIF